MKNLKLVVGAIGLTLVGVFVGYKILDKAPDAETPELDVQNKSINEMMDSSRKDQSMKNISAIFRILTSRHAISSSDHVAMRNEFWTVPPDSIAYDISTINDICDLYLPNENQDWIEFKPKDTQTAGDIGFIPVKKFDKTTSCYFIPFFLGIKNLMKHPGDKLYITKGKKDIVVGGNPPAPYTVILFRLVIQGKPTHLCYNISTDPGP